MRRLLTALTLLTFAACGSGDITGSEEESSVDPALVIDSLYFMHTADGDSTTGTRKTEVGRWPCTRNDTIPGTETVTIGFGRITPTSADTYEFSMQVATVWEAENYNTRLGGPVMWDSGGRWSTTDAGGPESLTGPVSDIEPLESSDGIVTRFRATVYHPEARSRCDNLEGDTVLTYPTVWDREELVP